MNLHTLIFLFVTAFMLAQLIKNVLPPVATHDYTTASGWFLLILMFISLYGGIFWW